MNPKGAETQRTTRASGLVWVPTKAGWPKKTKEDEKTDADYRGGPSPFGRKMGSGKCLQSSSEDFSAPFFCLSAWGGCSFVLFRFFRPSCPGSKPEPIHRPKRTKRGERRGWKRRKVETAERRNGAVGGREWGQGNDNPAAEAHAKTRRREATLPFSRSLRLRVRPLPWARRWPRLGATAAICRADSPRDSKRPGIAGRLSCEREASVAPLSCSQAKAIEPQRGARVVRPAGGGLPCAYRRLAGSIRPPISCAFLRLISLGYAGRAKRLAASGTQTPILLAERWGQKDASNPRAKIFLPPFFCPTAFSRLQPKTKSP
jgi:hypothetical protein